MVNMPPKKRNGRGFVLVRWLEEESIGVMPVRSIHEDDHDRVFVGAFVRVKWTTNKYYDTEILKLSGKNAK